MRNKRRLPLTDATRTVINALRDKFAGHKIWIDGDRIEVDRKHLTGYVATPPPGGTTEQHIATLIMAIEKFLKLSEISDKDEIIVGGKDPYHEVHPYIGKMSDKSVWMAVQESSASIRISTCLIPNIAKSMGWTDEHTKKCFEEYIKFMYLNSIHENCVPSANIDMVWRCHVTYTKSYAALCTALEGFVHYKPWEDMTFLRTKKYQNMLTLTRYKKEFDQNPPMDIWGDTERSRVRIVDPNKYFIIKRPWRRI